VRSAQAKPCGFRRGRDPETGATLALTRAGAKIRGSASKGQGESPVRQEFWGV
jgi:hypothetical protein